MGHGGHHANILAQCREGKRTSSRFRIEIEEYLLCLRHSGIGFGQVER